MNLYQVGYYRKDAGNVVTLINSIIVKEKKQHLIINRLFSSCFKTN